MGYVSNVIVKDLSRLGREYLVADENRFAEILARKSNKQYETEKKTVQANPVLIQCTDVERICAFILGSV